MPETPKNPEQPGELNEAAWRDVNEAVGEALGTSPPDPSQDRAAPDAPASGTSPARLVPLADDQAVQPKVEDNGTRYQMVSAQEVRELWRQRQLQRAQEEIERRNREAAARAHPAFRRDGSLAGYYAPLQGDASTPDVVDAAWWLSLPKAQAIMELGLRNEDEYLRVYNDIAPVVTQVENRHRQLQGTPGYSYVPVVIRRRKRSMNTDLFQGGRVTNIKPMTDPDNVPKPRRLPG
jgi:hypothetical protein